MTGGGEEAAGGVAVFEGDGRIRHVSAPLRRLLGRDESERMRRAGDVAIHPDDAARAARLFEVAEHTGAAQGGVLRLRHRDGHWVWVDARLGMVDDPGPPPTRLRRLEVTRDVSEERSRLLSQVLAAREEERTRIADDVHDDTVQAIMAVEIKLDQLRRRLDDPRQVAIADEMRTMLHDAAARLRRLIFDLQPAGVPRGGLAGAVADFAHALFDGAATQVDITAELPSEPGPETGVTVLRLLQEALRNVRRHARASTCSVRLSEADGGVAASVEDDGVGFDVEDLQRPRPGHRGMASMRERAELTGGWLRLQSRPGGGTALSFWVPDRGAAEDAAGRG